MLFPLNSLQLKTIKDMDQAEIQQRNQLQSLSSKLQNINKVLINSLQSNTQLRLIKIRFRPQISKHSQEIFSKRRRIIKTYHLVPFQTNLDLTSDQVNQLLVAAHLQSFNLIRHCQEDSKIPLETRQRNNIKISFCSEIINSNSTGTIITTTTDISQMLMCVEVYKI